MTSAEPKAVDAGPRLVRQLVAAAAAGGVLVLAFPPAGLWWLAPVAVGVLVMLLRDVSFSRGVLTGLVFGVVFIGALTNWLLVIGPDAWLAVTVVFGAGVFALLGLGGTLVLRLPLGPLWFAFWWVSVEALRSHVPLGGFPWGRLGQSQVDAPTAALASIGGTPLLGFVVALSGALLAAALVSWRKSTRGRSVLLVAAAAGLVAVGVAVPLGTSGRPVTVAVVQGNVPGTGLDAFGRREAVLDAHLEATRQLAQDVRSGTVPAPDFVVWPENASDIDPYTDDVTYQRIQSAVDDIGVPVLTGLVIGVNGGTQLSNRGTVWTPGDGPGAYYEKQHLVPFGEYVPFRSAMQTVISRLDRVPRDFVAGTSPGVLDLGAATVADAICYDVAYDDTLREAVQGGGELLTVQTNNATYGHTWQVPQQFAISRLRAIEHGRSLLVAATSGISAIVTPDGSVIDETPEFVSDELVAQVPARTSETLATRYGQWLEALMSLVGVAAVATAAVQVRRRRGQ